MNTTLKIKPKSVYRKDRHNRVSIRLKGYDYSRAGLYFITICCHHRVPRFGVVVNGKMELNEFGKIAYAEWLKLSERFSNVELDAFQIMPDHMHGIIILNNPVGAGFTPAPAPAPLLHQNRIMQIDGPTATPEIGRRRRCGARFKGDREGRPYHDRRHRGRFGGDREGRFGGDREGRFRGDREGRPYHGWWHYGRFGGDREGRPYHGWWHCGRFGGDREALARRCTAVVRGAMVDSGATARVALTTVGGIVVDSAAAAAMVDSGATARGALTTVGGTAAAVIRRRRRRWSIRGRRRWSILGRPRGSPLPRLVALWVRINPWFLIDVWIFINSKTKQWGNFGNATITNTSYGTNNPTYGFPNTSSTTH